MTLSCDRLYNLIMCTAFNVDSACLGALLIFFELTSLLGIIDEKSYMESLISNRFSPMDDLKKSGQNDLQSLAYGEDAARFSFESQSLISWLKFSLAVGGKDKAYENLSLLLSL